MLLSESLLARLRGLALSTTRRRRGMTAGERRSSRRGRSVEFADYREYSPGDDPRRVDWNVFARHERAVVKLYEEEEDLAVHILVDQSASMYPHPQADDRAATKFTCAAQHALLPGYIALAAGDVLDVQLSTGRRFGPRRGLAAFAELTHFLTSAPAAAPNARLALDGWLKACAQGIRPGLCLLLSDLFDERGWQSGFNALGAAGLELAVLHVLSPDELDPPLSGDVRLRDVETGDAQDLSIDERLLATYRRRLQDWTAEIATGCRSRGGRYLLVDSSQPPERIVLHDLRKAGWLS